jgi:hypothetical protein
MVAALEAGERQREDRSRQPSLPRSGLGQGTGKGAPDVLNEADIHPRAGEGSAGGNSIRKPMLYPLSYEGRPAILPGPEPTVLALVRVWSAGLAGPQCPRLAPRAVSHGCGWP